MAIIKNLAFFKKSKIKDLVSFVGEDNFVNTFAPAPLDFFNHLLPLKLKFLQEAFVSLENKKIKGLIELKKERGDFSKLKITKLFLEQNSYMFGEQLINYVMSRYCAYGANSFYVIFDEKLDEMANLFVDTCKFRLASYETVYKVNKDKLDFLDKRGLNFGNFTTLKATQTEKVCEMYNDTILPHLRPFFQKNIKFFTESRTSGLFHHASFKYVLENSKEKNIYGYFDIFSPDDKNYVLNIVLSPCCANYFMDTICFAIRQIEKRNKNWNLYIKIRHNFTTSQDFLNLAQEYKFDFVCKNVILIKDFFKPVKQDILENAKILFNDIAPLYRPKT